MYDLSKMKKRIKTIENHNQLDVKSALFVRFKRDCKDGRRFHGKFNQVEVHANLSVLTGMSLLVDQKRGK